MAGVLSGIFGGVFGSGIVAGFMGMPSWITLGLLVVGSVGFAVVLHYGVQKDQ